MIRQLKEKLRTETGLYEREKLIKDIKASEKHTELTSGVNKKAQIRELRKQDIERNKEGRRVVARRNQETIDKNRSEPTRFTGVVKYLSITLK